MASATGTTMFGYNVPTVTPPPASSTTVPVPTYTPASAVYTPLPGGGTGNLAGYSQGGVFTPVTPDTTTGGGGNTSTTPTTPVSTTGTTTAQPYQPGTIQGANPTLATPTGGTDLSYGQAQQNLQPSATPKPEDFFARVQAEMQPVLDQINKATIAAEQAASRGAAITSTQETSAMNAGAAARGLAGSSAGEAQSAAITAENGKTIADATAQAEQWKASTIQTVMQNVLSQSSTDFQNAISRSDTQSANYVATQQANAQKSVKSLALTGMTLDQMQQTDPNAYQTLLQRYNGDANTMKADWIAAAMPSSLDGGKPIMSGTHLIYTFKDITTGKTITQSIDTGVPLGTDWVTSHSSDGAMFMSNTQTGEFKQLTSPDPYYKATKQANLDSKSAMLISRYGTAVNNIIKQLYPTPTSNPMNLYSNALNYTTKLNTSYKASTDTSITDKGPSDLELMDAAIKINNGGQQITEAQFNAFNNSLGALGEAKLGWDKFQGALSGDSSLLLTQGQRDAIYKLANENVAAQKENAINATRVIAGRATRAGVPSKMVSTPEDIMGLSAAANQAADSSAGAVDPAAATSDLQAAGATDNGDGTWTLTDGTVIDTTQ